MGTALRLSNLEQQSLLAHARASLTRHLGLEAARVMLEASVYGEERGVFVTIRRGGRLRGCIGYVEGHGPLRDAVGALAIKAARDPRFSPVVAEELPELRFEISVLTPLEAISGPGEVEIGRDGLVVRLAGTSGLLLPQVASERGWSVLEFLAQTSRKAGLPVDAWQDPQARLYRFSCDVMEEAAT